MHMNTHSDAHEYSLEQELLPKFHNFGGEYQFAIESACICLKRRLISILTVWHIIEPRYEISNNVVCATSKGSDQPTHTCSLIRAFAGRLNIL